MRREDMEEQASLQAAQGGSEQKCGNDKCIMCTTLDRFGGLSACFGKDDDFEKKITCRRLSSSRRLL